MNNIQCQVLLGSINLPALSNSLGYWMRLSAYSSNQSIHFSSIFDVDFLCLLVSCPYLTKRQSKSTIFASLPSKLINLYKACLPFSADVMSLKCQPSTSLLVRIAWRNQHQEGMNHPFHSDTSASRRIMYKEGSLHLLVKEDVAEEKIHPS